MPRLTLTFTSKLDYLRSSIITRWGIIDWNTVYPWWRSPAKVRILMYADGSVRFNGGPFLNQTTQDWDIRCHYRCYGTVFGVPPLGGSGSFTSPAGRLTTPLPPKGGTLNTVF